MIVQSLRSDDAPADVVIVGAGTAGLFLAVRLRKLGLTVLVLESGGSVAHTLGGAETAEAVGRAHRGTLEARAVGLGGTSTLWGGQLARFDAADFSRSYAPWPLEADTLEGFAPRVFSALGLSNPLPNSDYRRQLGNEIPSADERIERFFTYWLPDPNFARMFRRIIVEDPGLRVLLNSPVTGISWDGENVAELLVAQDWQSVRGSQVVLATGTIGASRLLLALAAQGVMPWTDNALTGRGFQDHLAGRAATANLLNEKKFRAYFENAVVSGIKLQPKLKWSANERLQQPADWPGMSGYFVFGSDFGEHLANLKRAARSLGTAANLSALKDVPASIRAVGGSLMPFVPRYVRERRVMAFFDRSLEFQLQAEQIPSIVSRISLSDRLAPDGLPAAEVNWQVDGRELHAMKQFVEATGSWFEGRGIGTFDIDQRLVDEDPAFLHDLIDTNHACGGASMANDVSAGLVDRYLRFFGTRNLYLASAAAFPSSSHANCTFTLLCLTERLSQHLAEQKA